MIVLLSHLGEEVFHLLIALCDIITVITVILLDLNKPARSECLPLLCHQSECKPHVFIISLLDPVLMCFDMHELSSTGGAVLVRYGSERKTEDVDIPRP